MKTKLNIENIAVVINNNQEGWKNIVETKPNVTLDIGTKLYTEESLQSAYEQGRVEERNKISEFANSKHKDHLMIEQTHTGSKYWQESNRHWHEGNRNAFIDVIQFIDYRRTIHPT